MLTTLFVNHYTPSHPARRAEIDDALRRNLDSPQIDRVVVLAQSRPDQRAGLESPKAVWVDVDCSNNPYERPTYRDYFEFVNRFTTTPYDLNIVANADIYFDDSLGLLREKDLEGVCVALTRWERHADAKPRVECWDNSQDAWLFQGRIRPVYRCDFPLGIYGCDNRIAWELRHADYWVINPCLDIRAWHLHASGVRWNGSAISGNTTTVKRSGITDYKLRSRRPSVVGCIAFSLWGTQACYVAGALENARMARQVYPGWTSRFYVDDTVPATTIDQLRYLKAEVIEMPTSEGASGTFWRFLVADDPGYERWIVRDVDSRLGYRDRRAVDEWIESGQPFHIMRDHPWQSRCIPGGMFGGLRGVLGGITRDVEAWQQKQKYGDDQAFLQQVVYPKIKDIALVHDSCAAVYSGNVRPFPTDYGISYRFVGERIFEDEHHLAEDKEALIHHALARPA